MIDHDTVLDEIAYIETKVIPALLSQLSYHRHRLKQLRHQLGHPHQLLESSPVPLPPGDHKQAVT